MGENSLTLRIMELAENLNNLSKQKVLWEKITRVNLDVDYAVVLPQKVADALYECLEKCVEYESPEKSRVKVFGKWHAIPRQQVAFGDPGTKYTFSGTTVPARPWPNALVSVRAMLLELTGYRFNFVLINRYRNGSDHIGEHRDNEPDLDEDAPIASLSLGQSRDFILKHGDARKKGVQKKNIPIVKILLEHGSLLLMNPPTNKVWYHSLPPRKGARNVRINLTFRCIKNTK